MSRSYTRQHVTCSRLAHLPRCRAFLRTRCANTSETADRTRAQGAADHATWASVRDLARRARPCGLPRQQLQRALAMVYVPVVYGRQSERGSRMLRKLSLGLILVL